MRTLLLALAALATLSLARPALSRACDCAHGEPDVAAARAKLATIVHGRVIAARDRGRDHEIDLYVVRAWAGATAGTTVTIPVDTSSCGYFFVPGDEALIFAPATGELEQCAGDRTARVSTGAAIAADAAALGPPTSSAALPARQPGPTAEVVFEGKVLFPTSYRGGFEVRATRPGRGAARRTSYRLITPSGPGCEVPIPANGSRVAVRAARVRGQLVVARCFDDLGVKVLAAPRRRRP